MKNCRRSKSPTKSCVSCVLWYIHEHPSSLLGVLLAASGSLSCRGIGEDMVDDESVRSIALHAKTDDVNTSTSILASLRCGRSCSGSRAGASAPCGLNTAFASIQFTEFNLRSTPSSAADRLDRIDWLGFSAAPAKRPELRPSVSEISVSSEAARERLPDA